MRHGYLEEFPVGHYRKPQPPKENSGPVLDCSQPFNTTKFLLRGWEVDEHDERSLSLQEVDFSQAAYGACLTKAKIELSGEKRLERLKEMDIIRPAGNVFQALLLDYEKHGSHSVLFWLIGKTHKIKQLDFFGLVLRDVFGDRYVLSLYQTEFRMSLSWESCYRSLDHNFVNHNLFGIFPDQA